MSMELLGCSHTYRRDVVQQFVHFSLKLSHLHLGVLKPDVMGNNHTLNPPLLSSAFQSTVSLLALRAETQPVVERSGFLDPGMSKNDQNPQRDPCLRKRTSLPSEVSLVFLVGSFDSTSGPSRATYTFPSVSCSSLQLHHLIRHMPTNGSAASASPDKPSFSQKG